MDFRVSAPTLDFYVDVRLRDFAGRWLAVADISGEYEVGIGPDPNLALMGSLTSLGPHATSQLLADPQLKVLEALTDGTTTTADDNPLG